MRSRTIEAVLLASAIVLWGVPTVRGGETIGQLSDGEDLGIDGFADILSAQIDQDGGLLTFVIDVRADIPTTLALPEDTITYIWLVDADRDPETGQQTPGLGSDFNIRAVIGETYGGGFIDVVGPLPGSGGGTVSVEGSRIRITVGLGQIANPAQFHWRCDAFQVVDGSYVPGNGWTQVATGTPSAYTAPARVTITTPLLMLCPSGPATGQLDVAIRDADGNVLSVGDYHLSFQSSNEAVATVDATGLVTAHSVPGQFNDTPFVTVSADGVPADNSAVIRSTSTDLGLTHQTYSGANIALYLVPSLEGVNLDQLTTDFRVVEGVDLAYKAQQKGFGTRPFGGGVHYFVLDVSDDPATVPCGTSGNPVRLGWEYGKPIHNSCYIVNVPENRVPQWGVMFHEMGHNFNGASVSFNQFIGAYGPHTGTYSEALATLCSLWSHACIQACGAGLGQQALDSIAADYAGAESSFRQQLADYQDGGAVYSTLDPNVLDGILLEMHDAYGDRIWYDLFSTFLPANEGLTCTIDSESAQATWFVAAMSASAEEDLRGLFETSYGFPIDYDAWDTILGCVETRVAARIWRPFGAITGDLDCDADVDGFDFLTFANCYNGSDRAPLEACENSLADIEADGDVDGFDFLTFANCYNGSERKPLCD